MGDRPTSATDGIPVSVWNDLVDMRNWWKQTYANGSQGKVDPWASHTDIIMVGNDTADALAQGKILELDANMLTTLTDRYPPWIVGVKPTAGNVVFAVLKRPVKAKSGSTRSIVPAQISGVCFVKVNVGATWHRRARPTKDSYVLTSGLFGPCEILSSLSTTGEQMVACSIGHSGNRSMFAKTTSSITAGSLTSGRLTLGSGTATIYDPYSTATQYADASHTATVYNMPGEAIASGTFVSLTPTDDWLPLAEIEPCTNPA